MGTMKIVSVSELFSWTPLDLNMEKLAEHVSLTNENKAEDGGNLLLLTRTARQEMFDFIQWGNLDTPVNRVEQGGLLAGRHYSLPGQQNRVCVVTHAFGMRRAKGTGSFLDATAEDWHGAYFEMDELSRRTGEKLEPLGWFHTHPNSLPTFMSGTDRETQGKIFCKEFNFALVLNPHTGSWKAYRSGAVLDACCAMLDTDDLEALCGPAKPEPEKPEPEKPEPEKPREIEPGRRVEIKLTPKHEADQRQESGASAQAKGRHRKKSKDKKRRHEQARAKKGMQRAKKKARKRR